MMGALLTNRLRLLYQVFYPTVGRSVSFKIKHQATGTAINKCHMSTVINGTEKSDITLEKYARYCLLKNIRNSKQLPLDYLWLRDHCQCLQCYSTNTLQRTMDALQLDLNSKPESLHLNEDKDELHIMWQDGHKSIFSVEYLLQHTYEGKRLLPHTLHEYRQLWNAETVTSISFPNVHCDELLSGDENLQKSSLTTLLESLMRYGLAFVSGCEASVDATQAVCEQITFIERTMFGGLWSFTSDASRSDTAYTNIYLAPHTDTTYLSQPAGVQVFHCLYHDGSGGDTLLVDGFACSDQLRRDAESSECDAYGILSTCDVTGEYRECSERHGAYHTTGHGPVLLHDDTGDIIRIRYNPYDRASLSTVSHHEVRSFYAAYHKLASLINAPHARYQVKLRPGTVLLVDNWRILHGRNAFTGRRHMCGCYLPRDYLVSRWRTVNGYRVSM